MINRNNVIISKNKNKSDVGVFGALRIKFFCAKNSRNLHQVYKHFHAQLN